MRDRLAGPFRCVRETGFPLERMNNCGCSLIFGHPQGPTGLRVIIELIEELALLSGNSVEALVTV